MFDQHYNYEKKSYMKNWNFSLFGMLTKSVQYQNIRISVSSYWLLFKLYDSEQTVFGTSSMTKELKIFQSNWRNCSARTNLFLNTLIWDLGIRPELSANNVSAIVYRRNSFSSEIFLSNWFIAEIEKQLNEFWACSLLDHCILKVLKVQLHM